jgi:hypothetical protein
MSPKAWLIALLAVVSASSAVGCNDCSRHSCPWSPPAIVVYAGADGGAVAVSGVEATLMGATSVTMACTPSANSLTATSCFWPGDTPVTSGPYSLVVTAPGYRSKELSATVSLVPASHCGCPGATIEPSTVTLEPS